MNPNTNCLAGMKCPKCDSYGPFDIIVEKLVRIHDDGSENIGGDEEWGEYAWCVACSHDTTVSALKNAS